jgi:hypothetical protein
MDYVTVAERKIPLVYKTDVFIAGGGCAGVGAAIAAARQGAKTLVVERMFCLGGTMTSGLMSKLAIAPRNHGLGEELIKRLDSYQDSHFLESRPEVPIDPELAKFMLDKMVIEEAEAEVLFGTTITDVIVKDRCIKAVIIDSLNGLEAVEAKYYIDCTGDGQLGFKSGASYAVGNTEGFSSSPTLMFRIANVNIDHLISEMESHRDTLGISAHERYTLHQQTPWQNRKAIAAEKYAHFADFIPFIKQKAAENPGMFTEWEIDMMLQRGLIFMNQPQGTHVLVNSTRIPYFKGNDNKELTKAVLAGRKQVEATFRFMKSFVPGFEKAFIMDTAAILGIRESRRITGDYIFTEKDVESLKKFDDAIVSNHGGIEIHSTKGEGTEIHELGYDEYYHVPYRSIIARDFDNLLMAGRCFSANHPALSAARNITYCMALGQAAGTAAALLTQRQKNNVRDIDIKALQEQLASIL